jgi:hypothetical protein
MKHPSSFTLDALALGALPPAEEGSIRDHLASCARCRDDAEAGRQAQERFAVRVLPATLPAIEALGPRRRAAWPWLAIPALAAVITLLLILGRGDRRATEEPDVRIKGAASLELYANRQGRVVRVRDGDPLAPGDRLRFVVYPDDQPYLLIASIDGAGKTSVYFPYHGPASDRIEQSPRIEIPDSIVLDDAPGPERIYAFFTSQPLAADVVIGRLAAVGAGGADAIRRQVRLDVPGEEQATVVFEKEMP